MKKQSKSNSVDKPRENIQLKNKENLSQDLKILDLDRVTQKFVSDSYRPNSMIEFANTETEKQNDFSLIHSTKFRVKK